MDTGFESEHPGLKDANLVGYRDFVGNDNSIVQDRGKDSHGTMMAGILVANGHYRGAAPNVDLIFAAALDTDGKTQSETTVADAIEWCWNEMDAESFPCHLAGP
ncbi:MAG: hypothetical protein Ct9H90mP16_03580 [Candidatus Poseidoniales archaeon]|nr:MAG: hypothetical protein Ct9H90mP16_03580 [Candidatus Poseidoniales archaeon]